ncbi:MAG: hypothetical protein OSB62_09090 [Alphaproteobacteria bacterium]|nr:hypothetical protein [Alphaproteobacteria bacterium]
MMFVLVLAQVAGVAHAMTESFHADHQTKLSVVSIESGVKKTVVDEGSSSPLSEQTNDCQYSCHGHCHSHIFISGKSFDTAAVQEIMPFPSDNQVLNGLVHGPDSPPPNIL